MSWHPADPWSYSYLLGLYLGDGYVGVTRSGRATLMVTCDAAYPELIDDCSAAMKLVLPRGNVVRYPTQFECIRVVSISRQWPEVIPQHGSSRKHDRPIVLAPWQREIVDAFPREFLRPDPLGRLPDDQPLQDPPPQRARRRVRVSAVLLSNLWADIRGLFCEYCERLRIRWTQSNHRNISVPHRNGVALLDAFIGPKR